MIEQLLTNPFVQVVLAALFIAIFVVSLMKEDDSDDEEDDKKSRKAGDQR